MRVVVIGYGPVGARFVEEMLPAVADGDVELTVVGAEAHEPYNRVLVADYATGRADRGRLEISDPEAVRAAGVTVRLEEAATAIDRQKRLVRLFSGESVPYDRLVLAVGARANVPTLGGLEAARRDRAVVARSPGDLDAGATRLPHGVLVMRALEDSEELRGWLERPEPTSVVVLGAGVLGMELALAVAETGASVSVVYHDAVPMGRNLDGNGGRVLAALANAVGVRTHPHARAEEVVLRHDAEGRAGFAGLVCADGSVVSGDLLVLSCGVSPRTELAAAAGLRLSTGILVDERLRSWTDPDIAAIGDCAQLASPQDVEPAVVADPGARVPGGPSGLIGPGWRQADWLAESLSAEARGAAEPLALGDDRPAVVMLKAEGVDVVAAGDVTPELWDVVADLDGAGTGDPAAHRRVAVWADPGSGRYVKTVGVRGVLTGFVAVGMPRTGAELALLYQRGGELPADRSVLLRLDGPDAAAPAAPSADAVTCLCNGVTAGGITEAVRSGCGTVTEVGARTRAGTGCGGCRDRIQELILAAAPVAAMD